MLIKYIKFILSISDISLNNLEINYYLTDYKKLLNKNLVFTKDQVNSGSCLIKDNGSALINIWRKEEILKVKLHELIHALKFSEYNDTNELMDNYKDKYNISLKYTLSNEAYIEIWANILNCYLISQTTNKNPLKFFMTMVDLERSYSIYLAGKLLNRINGENNFNINKNTHVFEYYIIKAEIYENISKFIDICIENKDYINIINNNKLMIFLLKNNKIKQNKRKVNTSNFIYKTLRMSVNELSVF